MTSELETAGKREEELTKRLEELRVQFNDKRTSMRDHVMHLENLKQEVSTQIWKNYMCAFKIRRQSLSW